MRLGKEKEEKMCKKKRSEEEYLVSDAVLVSRKEKLQFYDVLIFEY